MEANEAKFTKLAQLKRRREHLLEVMEIERQEAELTAELQGTASHGASHSSVTLPTPPPLPSAAPPSQPIFAQDAKPHVGTSREEPITLEDTPPPVSRGIKREATEAASLLEDLDEYAQQGDPYNEAQDDEDVPRAAKRRKRPACADCRARRVRCSHKSRDASLLEPQADEAAAPETKSKRKSTKVDHEPSKKLYGPVVDDVNYESIIKAIDSDDYVELACPICQGNCYINHRKDLFFFRGASGLMGHINICHASQKWEGFSTRSVAERAVRRTLSAEEVDAVLNGRHGDFTVEQVIASGADDGSFVKKQRKKRKSAIEPDSRTDSMPGMASDQGGLANSGVPKSLDEITVTQPQQSNMGGFQPINGTTSVRSVEAERKRASQTPDGAKRARKTAPGGPAAYK